MLREAEILLRTHFPSQTVRATRKGLASNRLTEMLAGPMREALRRLRRSTFLFLFVILALIAFRLLAGPIGFSAWFLTMLAAYGMSFVALFLPARSPTARTPESQVARDEVTIGKEFGL